MADSNYEAIGRFIYGAYRHGGTGADVEHWIADDLGVARADPASGAQGDLYTAFFAKHTNVDELQKNYIRFIDFLKSRA